MRKFYVEVGEYWIRKVEVEAENEEEAIQKASDFDDEELGSEYVEDLPQRPYVEEIKDD